jgi:xanthine dehydrogenase YagR molybdenum-binding subunit
MQDEDKVEVPTWPPRAELKVLNHDLVRVDARAKVTGAARYTHDIRVEGMAYARLLLAPVPALKITKLDMAPALKVPGVLAVVVIEDKRTRWLGEPIAAVAATTPERAEDGLRAIVLEYEREGWVVNEAQALAPGAPKVHAKEAKVTTDGDRDKSDKACAGAAASIEETYTVPVQHHACLETHGVVVDYMGGDEAVVYCSTQHTFSFAGDAAKALDLKSNRVTGIVEYMGGGFGAKFGLGAEGLAACRLSKEIKRPVHLMMSRRDEFLAAGNRSGGKVKLKLAAAADGKLVGLVAERRKFGGIGEGSMTKLPFIYAVEESYSSTVPVYTNTDSNRAMRAPGHPQGAFAMESALDELAYKVGIDPLAMRIKNLKDPVWHRQLERVAKEIGWYEHPHRDKPGDPKASECIGIGFGIARWGGGGGEGTEVEVRIEKDGSVTASVGTQDLGTGSRTYVAAITAEEFGLRLADVTARIGSTKLGSATGSGGSTTTGSLAPAVKVAAANAARAFRAKLAPVFGIDGTRLKFVGGQVVDEKGEKPALAWKQACGMLPAEGLSAKGEWSRAANKSLAANGVHGAQAAKVRVDTNTGRVHVLEMIAMQDCGLPLNRVAVVSQTNGGMIQALSYALFEERLLDPELGIMLNPSFEAYKLVGSLEMPLMRTILDDEDGRGVIGVAEATCIPGHSAIVNAVHNACGARIRELPLTPDKLLAALGKVV